MARNTSFPGLPGPATREQAEQLVFGHAVADELYGDLAGDIARNANIEVTFNDHMASKNKDYRIKVRSNNALYSSTIRMNPGEFEYSECAMKLAGTGIARLILHLVATTARESGFDSLVGAGSKFAGNALIPATNGYYAYPKYGFEASIPADVLALITPEQHADLVGRTTVLDLMEDEPGRSFWKEQGIQLNHMVFNLTPGSRNWQRLCTLPCP